jgi:hypothetical protein
MSLARAQATSFPTWGPEVALGDPTEARSGADFEPDDCAVRRGGLRAGRSSEVGF